MPNISYLGVDPGRLNTGWCIVNEQGFVYVWSTHIHKPNCTTWEDIRYTSQQFQEVMARYTPTIAVIELPPVGSARGSVMSMIAVLGAAHNFTHVEFQTPQQRLSSMATARRRLKDFPHTKHEVDALAHVLAYLKRVNVQ